jgi:phosphotransferase system HPr-like phosphotransfer protein
MAFAKMARLFKCEIRVHHGEQIADGRSPTELLMLIAPTGTELVLELVGDDAPSALDPLCSILAADADVAHQSS